jgi:hypothetical protein
MTEKFKRIGVRNAVAVPCCILKSAIAAYSESATQENLVVVYLNGGMHVTVESTFQAFHDWFSNGRASEIHRELYRGVRIA